MQVRAPTHVVSTICDDRGEEPTYAGVPMSALIESDANVGDAIG
jgi:ATP citrate (pro-S)-lyase